MVATRGRHPCWIIKVLIEEGCKKAQTSPDFSGLEKLALAILHNEGLSNTTKEVELLESLQKYWRKKYQYCEKNLDGEIGLNWDHLKDILSYLEFDGIDEFVQSRNIQRPTQTKTNNRGPIPLKFFDTYSLFAQFLPGIVALTPLIVLAIWILKKEYNEGPLTLTSIGLGLLLLLFLFSSLSRSISKRYQERYFTNGPGFPTVYLLLFNDNRISSDIKKQYRQKAKEWFDIDFPTEDEEGTVLDDVRAKLLSVTELAKPFVYQNRLIRIHNNWYGFKRNVIGASVTGLLSSLIVLVSFVVFDERDKGFWLSIIVCLLIYTTIFLSRKTTLIRAAETFGKQFIFDFLRSERK